MQPGAPGFDGLDSEFLLGPDLLVAPPQFPEMLDDYTISYPGGPWFDFWTGRKVPDRPTPPSFLDAVKAGSEAKFPDPPRIHPTLETLPVYVRGGSILPLQPLVQSTSETPNGPLELRVYPGPLCSGSLYLDDGHTFRYQKGEFLRQSFGCQSDGKSVSVKFEARTGTYAPWWKTVEVVVYDWPSAQADARMSGSAKPLKTTYDASAHALHISIPDVAGGAELRVGEQKAN
jgi:alpha-glucosidase